MVRGAADRIGALAQLGARIAGSDEVTSSSLVCSTNIGGKSADIIIVKEDFVMVEKNLKKLQAKKRRVTNGFNTGTRDMKLKTAYRRNKRWSADSQDAGHRHYLHIKSLLKNES